MKKQADQVRIAVVNIPITAETPIGAVAATLQQILEGLREPLVMAYGVGVRPPEVTAVPLQFGRVGGRDVVVARIEAALPDDGTRFRGEVERRKRVAEMMARIAVPMVGGAS